MRTLEGKGEGEGFCNVYSTIIIITVTGCILQYNKIISLLQNPVIHFCIENIDSQVVAITEVTCASMSFQTKKKLIF